MIEIGMLGLFLGTAIVFSCVGLAVGMIIMGHVFTANIHEVALQVVKHMIDTHSGWENAIRRNKRKDEALG